jgi:dinuclear metal center YbgI/SA1388 family protein
MDIQTLLRALEEVAPPVYQESYDNAGLIAGNPGWVARGAVLCLDATEAVVEEAIALGCNLVIAHHPIVFKPLKRFTGKNYVERTLIKAIKHDIAIYAAHTNLDNVFHQGVNARIAERLGLVDTQILAPRQVWKKMLAEVPENKLTRAMEALSKFAGIRTHWFPDARRLEIICYQPQQSGIQAALEEAADQRVFTEIFPLETLSDQVGAGMIGRLPVPVEETDFLMQLKEKMKASVVRHTVLLNRRVQRVAICGGSGGFLLPQAMARGADIFITGDYKYHEFFDADGQILIADIGHFESEQFTVELFYEILSGKFPNFALHYTKVNTNPVHYFV